MRLKNLFWENKQKIGFASKLVLILTFSEETDRITNCYAVFMKGVVPVGKIVVKFGGSSLADASQFRKVKSIIEADPARCFVVPSAPGKRNKDDTKITDLLYRTFRANQMGEDITPIFTQIRERYVGIAQELSLKVDIESYLAEVERNIRMGASEHYCASRGEYLNGLLLADYLGFEFLDPKEYIFFNEDGRFDEKRTNVMLSAILQNKKNAVIPGFYGSDVFGEVHTFSRGGSDITGAIVARAGKTDLYENWTDVSGFMMADPRIVKDAKSIRNITYRELRELSYMGATVLHEDSIFPVNKAGIPTNIRNTNAPDDYGTMIMSDLSECNDIITGIAGKKGFSVVSIEKAMMNCEIGFGRRALQALEDCGLSFEHMPTGIDSLCIILSTAALEPVRDQLIRRIVELTEPDTVTIHDNLSIVATVGRGMVENPGTAARVFSALSKSGVNVRMIDQGSSELSILVGVNDDDFNKAIEAIYREFVKE